MSELAAKLLGLHDALNRAEVAHAFGGAIALAYCVEEPRGTRDLDLNVFARPLVADKVLGALPDRIDVSDWNRNDRDRVGHGRLWWSETPVDIFLSTHWLHDALAEEVVWVPFQSRDIPVLGGPSLAVLKALANRPKDWADIEAMKDCYRPQVQAAAAALARMVGEDAPACQRIEAVLARSRTQEPPTLKHLLESRKPVMLTQAARGSDAVSALG